MVTLGMAMRRVRGSLVSTLHAVNAPARPAGTSAPLPLIEGAPPFLAEDRGTAGGGIGEMTSDFSGLTSRP